MQNPVLQNLLDRVKAIEQYLPKLTNLTARSEVAGAASRVTYAELPTPGKKGRWYYVLDARTASEGAGAGTGCLAVDNGTNWVYVDRPEVAVVI